MSAEDLQKIIEALRSDKLPETEGFFFGNEEIDEEEIVSGLKINYKTRNRFKNKKNYIYIHKRGKQLWHF